MEEQDIIAIQKEFTILQSLNHPNILSVYNMHMTESSLIISMELVEGQQLDYFVQQKSTNDVLAAINKIDPEKYKQLILYYQNDFDLKYIYQSFIRSEILGLTQQDSRTSINIQLSQIQVDDDYPIIYKNQMLSPVVEKHKFDYTTELSQIFLQICDALSYLEDQHIQHNDLKVQNIMLQYSIETQSFIVKIIDFGLSDRQSKKQLLSSGLQGTLGYISPDVYEYYYLKDKLSFAQNDEQKVQIEQKLNQLYDSININKGDIYALGGILFYMLTGYQPFITTRDTKFNLLQIKNCLYLPLDLCIKNEICAPYFTIILDYLLQPDSSKRMDAKQIKQQFLYQKKIYTNSKSHLISYKFVQAINIQDFKKFSQNEQYVPVIKIKLCMIGDYKIGKSKFTHMLSNNQQVQIIQHQNQLAIIQFSDTHGTEGRRNSIIGNACEDLDLGVLCSPVEYNSIDDLVIWKSIVQSFSQNCKFSLLLFDEQIIDNNQNEYIVQQFPNGQIQEQLDNIQEEMQIFYYSTVKYNLQQYLHDLVDIILQSNEYKIQMVSTKYLQQHL